MPTLRRTSRIATRPSCPARSASVSASVVRRVRGPAGHGRQPVEVPVGQLHLVRQPRPVLPRRLARAPGEPQVARLPLEQPERGQRELPVPLGPHQPEPPREELDEREQQQHEEDQP